MMDGSQGNSNSPAPFLTKTYDMVEDPSTNPIVSWSPSNNSFVVWDQLEFARDLLPKYFKHNNFSSFVRQLNTYGFRKVDPDQWEFANDEFIRGQKHLLKNIHRRKPIHSHTLPHQGQGSLIDAEREEFQDEIERLKRHKNLLMLELKRHTSEKCEIEKQMQSLDARLQNLDNRQGQILSFLAETVNKPGFLSTLMQPSEVHGRKRRLPKSDIIYENVDMDGNKIVAFQPVNEDYNLLDTMSTVEMGPLEKMEFSFYALESFVLSVSLAASSSGEEGGAVDGETGGIPPLSSFTNTEMHASPPADTDVDLQTQPPKLPPSPSPEGIRTSLELAETVTWVDSPSIPIMIEHAEPSTKISLIDVNSEPEVSTSKDQVAGGLPVATAQARTNDVFWQQFLTETPGSNSDTQEVDSCRKDMDVGKGEVGAT